MSVNKMSTFFMLTATQQILATKDKKQTIRSLLQRLTGQLSSTAEELKPEVVEGLAQLIQCATGSQA